VRFKAKVKADSANQLRRTLRAVVAPEGIQLTAKNQPVLTIPRPTPAAHDGGNLLSVDLPGRRLTLAVSKFPAYQTRTAAYLAEYLRGRRATLIDEDVRLEPYLLVPAVLPFGIMLLTRGGAIWGALGGGIAFGCLAIAQNESMPKAGRIAVMLLINAVLYAVIIFLVIAASRPPV
jgi:hypothetical protein